MAKGFDQLKLSTEDIRKLMLKKSRPIGIGAGPIDNVLTEDTSPEQVARAFLIDLGLNEIAPKIRSLGAESYTGTRTGAAPSEAQLVKSDERMEEITKTKVVSFEQVKDETPIFGSRVVVEIDAQSTVVSASVDVAAVDDFDTDPAISNLKAQQILAEFLSVDDPQQLPEPVKTILPHPNENGALHLAWYFQHVLFSPPATEEDSGEDEDGDQGGCCAFGLSLEPDFDYFIDAHTSELIYFYPNSAHIDIPTRCRGQDEDGQYQSFFGRLDGPDFRMENPFEDVRTLDLGLQPFETTTLPVDAIGNATSDWQNSNPAAVSAHVNATRVLDFLFRILRRDSIDGNGMVLENIVNCSSNRAVNPPEWINAVWYQDKMWYGQQAQAGGGFISLSRFLDVIAHEMFHGVTQNTANLVYAGQSGALNESISDIFGVIIRNWHLAPVPGDVSTWSWDIGSGLGAGGGPLRSMSNPSSVGKWRRPNPAGSGFQIINGYPKHMSQYVTLPVTQTYDWGGVHWYSNIHNLAAHNVLTSRRQDNSLVFSPEEVAILFYLVLTRLTRLSDFDDARSELIVVSDTLNGGNQTRRTETHAAITQAYDAVGIV